MNIPEDFVYQEITHACISRPDDKIFEIGGVLPEGMPRFFVNLQLVDDKNHAHVVAKGRAFIDAISPEEAFRKLDAAAKAGLEQLKQEYNRPKLKLAVPGVMLNGKH